MNLQERNRFRPTIEGLETRAMPAFIGSIGSVITPTLAPAVMAPTMLTQSSINQKVIDFARANIGNTVRPDMGGDCYDFAAEALRKAGVKVNTHQGAGTINGQVHYIWGSTVYQKSKMSGWSNKGSLASIKAGDVIQFDGVKFENGNGSQKTSHHTAIVESVDTRTGVIKVIHQNIGGVKKVFRGQYDVDNMVSGVMTIYRPQSR